MLDTSRRTTLAPTGSLPLTVAADPSQENSVSKTDDSSGRTPREARGTMSNAAWNVLSTLLSIVASLVIAPVLIHRMGTEQYGLVLLIWSFTGVLGLMSFGFGEATLRYLAHYFGAGNIIGVNQVMGSTLTLYLVISLAVCTGLLVAAPLVVTLFNVPTGQQPVLTWLLRLSALVFSFRAVSLTYGAVPMALQRYDISCKLGVGQNVARTGGYIMLALSGSNVLHLLIWDVVLQAGTLVIQAIVARKLTPGIMLLPSLSFKGLNEIAGFSVFSFLTYLFHMVQREAGKIILAAQLGPVPLAHLGTPDNVAQRIHMVVASGSETLMPRFSGNRDHSIACALFWHGTWASLVSSLVLLLPFAILLPDFLRLWIGADFARESAAVAQLVALSYVAQGAYAPAAAFFRGTGRPWLVTVVIFFAGLMTLGASMTLIPRYGTSGVGIAYILGSTPALAGLMHCWFHMFGRTSLGGLARLLLLPSVMAAIAVATEYLVRRWFGDLSWLSLLLLGGAFAGWMALLIFGADWVLGGPNAPSKRFLAQVTSSRKFTTAAGLLRGKFRLPQHKTP